MKKCTAIFLTLAMLFVMVGCSQTAENSSSEERTTSASASTDADIDSEENESIESSDIDSSDAGAEDEEVVTSKKNVTSKKATSSKKTTTSQKVTTSKKTTSGKESATSSVNKNETSAKASSENIANISSTSSQQEEVKDVKELVDFIVEVEAGKDPVVLQLTDTQIIDSTQERTPDRIEDIYTPSRMEPRCFKYIREVVEKTKPDLILVTGDLVYGEFDDKGSSFKAFVEFMERFGIPWAPVFGNHEAESAKGIDWQCTRLTKAEHCLFKQRELTGNGNYTVGISQGGKLQRVFFMLDSNGNYAASTKSLSNGHTKTSVGFGSDQIAWYTETGTQIKQLSPTTKISFAFHIQLAVFAEAFSKYGFDNTTTKEKPINIDKLGNKAAGDFGYLGRNLKSSWDSNNNVWNSIKSLGCDSIFVGHEHCNSASVVYQGVRLQYGQKSSTYDRANYYNKETGAIEGLSGTVKAKYTPIIGGTVIPLSKKDGSITSPYIYLCADAGGNLDLTK